MCRHSGNDALANYVDKECGDVLQWDTANEDGSFVPWLEVNGKRSTASGEDLTGWDMARTRAGSMALEELPLLDLNASTFQEDEQKAHWPQLRMAYKRSSEKPARQAADALGDVSNSPLVG